MTSQQPGIDLAAQSTSQSTLLSYLALVLGVLSVPGSVLTWDSGLPGEGFVWGLPAALLAVVLGVAALRARTGVRWAAVTGLVLGGAMVTMITVWTVASGG